MSFLLDTNVCIHLLNGSRPGVTARFAEAGPVQVKTSAITMAELQYGARKSRRVADNLALIDRFLEPLTRIPFDDRCAVQYGLIRAELERTGTPIGSSDLLIAATARAHDLALVTHNTSEFGRVVGLRVVDWEQ